MSPRAYVCVCLPSLEISRGKWPNFSLLKRSFNVRVSGSNDMKSRAVGPSISFAVIVLPLTISRIFMCSSVREVGALSSWLPATAHGARAHDKTATATGFISPAICIRRAIYGVHR